MTKKLYDIDSSIKEFEAKVLECIPFEEGYRVLLDATAFFPEAGGQPSDRGYLDDIEVFNVEIENEEIIYHFLKSPLEVGKTVKGKIDWERRFDFMQQHTGEHIVSGVAHELFGCENVGFHLSEEIVTLDFDKALTKEDLNLIEEKANEAVFKNAQIKAYYPDSETLKTLNYRSKKEIDAALRIVEIEGTDMCACCAPHVKTTGEVGIIKILSSEAMRGGVRLQIKCGKRAFLDYSEKQNNIAKISALLCVKQSDTAVSCERLLSQIDDLKYTITGLKRKLQSIKLDSMDFSEKITLLFEEDAEIKDLQNLSDTMFKAHGGIRGALSETDGGYYFAFCGEEKELAEFFSDLRSKLTIRGGGRGNMVQGTILATKEEIEKACNI